MQSIFIHDPGQNTESWNKTISLMDESVNILCPDLTLIPGGKDMTYENLYLGSKNIVKISHED